MKDELFFVGQKAFIEKDGKVLILIFADEKIDFPGGKIQEGEIDPKASLEREVLEEVGIKVKVGQTLLNTIEAFPLGHKLYGKRVFISWYSCEYESGEVTLSEEHDNYFWVNKESYKSVDDGTSYFAILEKYFNL